MTTSSIEERLRDDLRRVAESIVSQPPMLVVAPTARRTRRHRIGLACIAGLALAGAGTAVALRLAPDDVQRMNDQITQIGTCGIALTDQAVLVATAERADGNRLELWITPTSTGEELSNLRIVQPDGEFLANGGGCGYVGPEWIYTATEHADGQTTGVIDIAGRTLTDAKSVRITFASGAAATAIVQDEGYFIVSLRDDTTRYDTEPRVEPVEPGTDTTLPN